MAVLVNVSCYNSLPNNTQDYSSVSYEHTQAFYSAICPQCIIKNVVKFTRKKLDLWHYSVPSQLPMVNHSWKILSKNTPEISHLWVFNFVPFWAVLALEPAYLGHESSLCLVCPC